jgi:uncharacterized protein (TIGR00255 family)
MIYSMTAFARKEQSVDGAQLTCEIRSVNHRYLETSVYLPDSLRIFEMPVREVIREHIKRGKLECLVRYQSQNNAVKQAVYTFNADLAKELCASSEKVAAMLATPAAINPTDILRIQGVLENKEKSVAELEKPLLTLIEQTVKALLEARQREGDVLKQLFLSRMDVMEKELAKVESRLPTMLQECRDRLLKRFADASIELDKSRLEQEMVFLAQKLDVAEEIDRTKTHIQEVRRILKEGGLVGRRLDFLLQELNREANTLGSKSTDAMVTHAAVELKVLIEQVREQVQNVE